MKVAILSPEAEADLISIWEFIAADSITNADRFVHTLRKKCDDLAAFPEMGRVRADLESEIRSFGFGNYLIFYMPTSSGISIARILSGFRDLEAAFEIEE